MYIYADYHGTTARIYDEDGHCMAIVDDAPADYEELADGLERAGLMLPTDTLAAIN